MSVREVDVVFGVGLPVFRDVVVYAQAGTIYEMFAQTYMEYLHFDAVFSVFWSLFPEVLVERTVLPNIFL